MDSIISMEVVLADGRVVNASETSHPDLFWVCAWSRTLNTYSTLTSLGASWCRPFVWHRHQVPAENTPRPAERCFICHLLSGNQGC